jgi:hypothetical protein
MRCEEKQTRSPQFSCLAKATFQVAWKSAPNRVTMDCTVTCQAHVGKAARRIIESLSVDPAYVVVMQLGGEDG